MVKLGCSFSGKPDKDPGEEDGAATDSVPLISPLDVSQLQPPFPDQVVIKTQMEYQLSSPEQPKKFPDLEAQKLACSHPEEGRKVTTRSHPLPLLWPWEAARGERTRTRRSWVPGGQARLESRVHALPPALTRPPPGPRHAQHKICTPLTLEMYYTEMDPERHRSILAAIGAYPLSRKYGTEMPSAWGESYRTAAKDDPKGPTQAAAATEPPGKLVAKGEKEEAPKVAGSSAPVSLQ
ncbi:neuron-specific vesicular protein calcyon [Trichechus manatus latirostris]|uniref:Neuron-specific vesicular protein calcyon n=1 Tax=Trichechus manatus latirostris TaxID=127582 RepID=A0A2Y9DIH8_TRIMA|nr:neuron-specific vesicular protein calcyon [Trichechus manatus latirostris]